MTSSFSFATLARARATQLHLKKKKKILANCSQINLISFKNQPATSKEHNLILIELTSMNSIV